MAAVALPAHNWTPRRTQLKLWNYLDSGGSRAIAICHRRWGKDEVCLHRASVAAMQRVGNYWHLLPEAEQARKAIWEAVNPHSGRRRIDEAFPLELRDVTRSNEMMIRFRNGSTWQVVGSDNYNSLVGSPPVGVTFSEWALADPNAWAYLRPILRENDGWAVFITTPRGKNHAHTMYRYALAHPEEWFSDLQSARDTDVYTPAQLELELQEYISQFGEADGTSKFEQEYLCSFEAAIVGAYYAGELRKLEQEKRIVRMPIEPTIPVDTGWDLGMDDATAIWFIQRVAKEIRLVDFYENSGQGFDHYAKVLKDKGYLYGTHFLPHDARVREQGTGISRKETLERLGVKPIEIAKLHDLHDGINATRIVLRQAWIDPERCSEGLERLHSYRRKWDDTLKTWVNHPLHDWASHGADALRSFAMGLNQVRSKDFFRPLKYDNRGVV